jgi:hypothetical protein
MPARVTAVELQALQREVLCRPRIAQPVLVVNRQRFGRFARDVRRTPAQIEDALPGVGRLSEPPLATAKDGVRPKRLGLREDVGPRV